jgi:hypothetical protein
MEETVHEHRNIAMIRRALEVDNFGDHNAMRGFLADGGTPATTMT